jgi:hypothetical protein
MEVNDTKKSLLTNELKLQLDELSALVSSVKEETTTNNTDSIQLSDEWTNKTNLFTNTKVEKIAKTSISDLFDVPSGVVYDSINDTLSFVDQSLSKYFTSSCKIEGSDTITLNELVSDINVFEALEKINNFGDIYDFQFKQVDYSTHKYANVKSTINLNKVVGYFSIDKLLNDELIRKKNKDSLHAQYTNTENADAFPAYDGFLLSPEYLQSGWVSMDQIIRSVYKDNFAYESNTSLAIRTPKILEAKRALIILTLSYICDIFSLNSFNKLADFGVRIFNRTTGEELSVTNTKIELIEKITSTIVASYSGKIQEPTVNSSGAATSQLIDLSDKTCKKVKTNKCDGSLFTDTNKQNVSLEGEGFVHEIDVQVRVNPFKELLAAKPDILNTIDPIHWTTGIDNLPKTGELFNLINEFGSNTYKNSKLNQDRAFAYGTGEFTNGLAAGGYFHDDADIGITSSTEAWNGVSWSSRSNCPVDTACGLAGGNQDLAVIAYGLKSEWSVEDKTYDKFFVPSINDLLTNAVIFQDNVWQIVTDLTPELPRHSVAGKLNIIYTDSVPGENIDKSLNKDIFYVCNEAISQAKQFASQKFDFSTLAGGVSGGIETPNTSPRVWFDIWQCNGIAFGGSNSAHNPLDTVSEKTSSIAGITDEFESISWIRIKKNTLNPESNEKIEELSTFGCWFVNPVRKYPIKALGVSYVGTNDSGIATGGKTSNSVDNLTRDNVKVNMKNYYFDASKFDINNLSVTPICYENNGITWIRREDLPEAVYYHAGVGDNEHALFFGGIHASLENPQVYTSFKNCQDWETLINVYGGSFARNGSYSLDGNIRYSSFSNLYDVNSKGAEDSFGNTYFKNRDANNGETSTVVYSDAYKASGNVTTESLYPDIDNFLNVSEPEFTFPNKQIHTNIINKLVYTYDRRYFVLDSYGMVYDLVFDMKIVQSYEQLVIDTTYNTITLHVTNANSQAVKDYFGQMKNIRLTSEEKLLSAKAFQNGYNKLVSIDKLDDSPANRSDLSIVEDKLTDSDINKMGMFTYFLFKHSKEFSENYVDSKSVLPSGVASSKENYFCNLVPKYAGHPGEGGMWLASRPTVGEVLFDPKNFLNNEVTKDELILHGLSSTDPNKYTYFVKPAIFEIYNNGVNNNIVNYRDTGLFQYLSKTDDAYTVNELWHNPFKPNQKLAIDIQKNVTRDGYVAAKRVKLDTFPRNGTESLGTFSGYNGGFESVFTDFTNDQFTSPEISLGRDLIHVQMYDNDYTGYLGQGAVKTSSIRDKAGLWPWVDLLNGDASNDCVVGNYTYRWGNDGSIYFAKVTANEVITEGIQNFKQESILITKYSNAGKKLFDYTIVYKETLDLAKLDEIDRSGMIFAGSGTQSLDEYLAAKKAEFGLYNVFGNSIKRQKVENGKYNSLHVYGENQNYEITDKTVMSYNWDVVCADEFTLNDTNKYPFKYTNLCELIKENDLYNDTQRYQLYLEGNTFGDNGMQIVPITPWYNPVHFRVDTGVKYIIPPQILSQDLCGVRENLIKMRYNEFKLNPHSGLLFGDIRIMGEDLDKCHLPSNCSLIACGDKATFNPDNIPVKGQPEYFMENLTGAYNLNWDCTGIATDFTSNMFGRFKRDAIGDDNLDNIFITNNGYNIYPKTFETSTPFDVANNPLITEGTLHKKPNVIIFSGGLFDVMYDKNFYETIYFIEEMAKMARENKILMVFLTIPPRGMMQYDIAIERHVWYNNLVGDGRLDDPAATVRMSVKSEPINGERWNVPMESGPYAGLADPFIGKTKLEKLVAINEWMKETLVGYNHDVLDLYDFFADKTEPAVGQHLYKFNKTNNSIEATTGDVYGFIKSEHTSDRFINNEGGQFGGMISNSGARHLSQFIFDSVDLIPRLNAKIMDFHGNLFDPIEIFRVEYPVLASRPRDTYFDSHKVGVENTYLDVSALSPYDSSVDTVLESVKIKANESASFSEIIHKVCYESLYFDLVCCLLKQDTCYASCYDAACSSLGDAINDPKYKWIQHNHEEWTVPILESPFAGPFSTSEFNVWLASGNVKNNRWGANIWSTVEGGVITLHHRKQRIGINDPQSGTANRGHIYYATIVTEVKITNIETSALEKPTPCRVFYDEFIFDIAAYSESGLDAFIKEIIRISYPNYSGSDLIPVGEEYNTKYEVLGLDCGESSSAYRPAESQLNPYATGADLCSTEVFTYTEWATSFIQEMKNSVSMRKVVDQKEDKYFLKYDINRPFGSTTYKESNSIELGPDIKVVNTEWRRYQDGVGMGGNVPILSVTSENALACNNLNKWYIGQSAFGTPDKAVVFGGFEITTDNGNNPSHLWWESLTSDLTFKWNKYVINPEDTFNANYANRSFAPLFTNKEPTTAKSSMGMILFDLTNNILVERQGVAIFDKQNNVSIKVDLPEIITNKDKYSITLTPSDNINCWWESKTSDSFVIKVDAEEWSGSVEWFVTINDTVQGTTVDQDPNKSYNSYEEL